MTYFFFCWIKITDLTIDGNKILRKEKIELEGELDLKDFINLKKIHIIHNQVLNLESTIATGFPELIEEINIDSGEPPLSDCNLSRYPNLTAFWASWNHFENLYFLNSLPHKEKIRRLGFWTNKIEDPDFQFIADNFPNLEVLSLTGNPLLKSNLSVEPLGRLKNFKEIWINDTGDLEGWEFMPEFFEKINGEEERWEKLKELLWEKIEQIAFLKQEQTLFSEQEQEINYLESRVQELTNLIKNQKEKIINVFLRFLPEKELIQQLIKTHLEFIRYKSQGANDSDYSEKKREYERRLNTIKDELEEKLEDEQMNQIKAILNDCEELVWDELELETKLADKAQLIEKQKQSFLLQEKSEESNKRIIYAEEATQQEQQQQFKRIRSNSLVTEIEKARLEGKVEVYKELGLLP